MKKLVLILAVAMLVMSATAVFADGETSEDILIASAPLNAQDTCPDGIDGWVKIDNTPEGVFSYDLLYEAVKHGTAKTNDPLKGLVSVVLDAGWKVDLCVKGGNTVVFAYGLSNGENSGTPVLGGSGQAADISHFSYRLIPPTVVDEWCSPGFWKNNYGAWGPTGYTPTSIDSVTGKTFGTILANPKTYAKTGDFERIADILSAAHPGVDFEGERMGDSCPLSPDEANK